MTRRRFPRYVYGSGTDPDPRFSLANERTFLAWLRTALALAAVAVALDVAAGAADVAVPGGFVAGLAGGSGLVSLVAWTRWARTERALRRREPLPGPALTGALMLAAVVGAAALAAGLR